RTEDIAGRLGISKATLYKEFSSKKEILRAVVGRTVSEIAGAAQAVIGDESRDFVEKTIGLLGVVRQAVAHMGGPLGQDIERYAPEIWKDIDALRREIILANFKTLISGGVREGALRDDVDQDGIVLMWVTLVQSLLTPAMIPRLPRSADALFEIMIKVVFEGLLTDQGRRAYLAKKGPLAAPIKEALP
ncbi:MAG: TetR/AcrR family transcriptional regulator, partial [Candidatus Aminicenantes bacterium]|nr:TetR/AcrR family transcriptional regulator [Candidatus Aminicenantes bacterium]